MRLPLSHEVRSGDMREIRLRIIAKCNGLLEQA